MKGIAINGPFGTKDDSHMESDTMITVTSDVAGFANGVTEKKSGSKTFWKNAKRRFESILNSICNIAPHNDLDAYEHRRIETLTNALDRAERIRRKFQYLDNADPARSLIAWNERHLRFPKVHNLVCTNDVRQITPQILHIALIKAMRG